MDKATEERLKKKIMANEELTDKRLLTAPRIQALKYPI